MIATSYPTEGAGLSTKPGANKGNNNEGFAVGAMGLSDLFKRSMHKDQAHSLYTALVGQAREPAFYRHCGVPDSLDGRFELIVVHAALLLRRLRHEGEAGNELGQTVFDVMIDDMDQSLREMGVGDLAVGRRVKAMARAFFGRAAAYEAALSAADEDAGAGLVEALGRNLYGTATADDGTVTAMAGYMRRETARLAEQPGAALLAGAVKFGAAPREDENGEIDG